MGVHNATLFTMGAPYEIYISLASGRVMVQRYAHEGGGGFAGMILRNESRGQTLRLYSFHAFSVSLHLVEGMRR